MIGFIFLIATALCCGFYLFKEGRYQTLHVEEKSEFQNNLSQNGFDGRGAEVPDSDAQYVEGEVLFSADSEEEARRVADAVNGRLKSWQNGIAVLSIDETVGEFLKKYSGAPGLPEMHPNYIYFTN